MKKRLSEHGNSLAMVIDKPILELLSVNKKTVFTISTDGRSIILTPEAKHGKISDDSKMQRAHEEIMEKYASVFKKLAKN